MFKIKKLFNIFPKTSFTTNEMFKNFPKKLKKIFSIDLLLPNSVQMKAIYMRGIATHGNFEIAARFTHQNHKSTQRFLYDFTL